MVAVPAERVGESEHGGLEVPVRVGCGRLRAADPGGRPQELGGPEHQRERHPVRRPQPGKQRACRACGVARRCRADRRQPERAHRGRLPALLRGTPGAPADRARGAAPGLGARAAGDDGAATACRAHPPRRCAGCTGRRRAAGAGARAGARQRPQGGPRPPPDDGRR